MNCVQPSLRLTRRLPQDKMSRALGTAFLSHQVAQLELENDGNSKIKGGSNGGGAWTNYHRGVGGGGGGRRSTPTPSRRSTDVKSPDNTISPPTLLKPLPKETGKEADRIVVDASVLIHGLGRVRAWCRDSSSSILIVPLEGLSHYFPLTILSRIFPQHSTHSTSLKKGPQR